MICVEYTGRVFDEIAALLDALSTPARLRPVYDKIVHRVEHSAARSELFMPIDVPVSIGKVHALDDRLLIVSAAACTLLWSGADLMDDAADGDAARDWGVTANQLELIYTNLLATLPHLAISVLDPAVVPGARALGPTIAEALWQMSVGQFDDLDSEVCVSSSEAYWDVISRKTGAEIALFASIPAILAGLSETMVAGWREFGIQFGCMVQLFSDVYSTFETGPRSDLYKGKRTLPVTLALEALSSDHRHVFETDIRRVASGDIEAHTRVIEQMHECRAVFKSLSRVELLRFRAARAVPVPLELLPRDHCFRKMLKCFSTVRTRTLELEKD